MKEFRHFSRIKTGSDLNFCTYVSLNYEYVASIIKRLLDFSCI